MEAFHRKLALKLQATVNQDEERAWNLTVQIRQSPKHINKPLRITLQPLQDVYRHKTQEVNMPGSKLPRAFKKKSKSDQRILNKVYRDTKKTYPNDEGARIATAYSVLNKHKAKTQK